MCDGFGITENSQGSTTLIAIDNFANCPEYKVTAVQISPSNGPSDLQKACEGGAGEAFTSHCACGGSCGVEVHRPVRTLERLAWRNDRLSEGMRAIPEETALALTYNGSTYAVMMGTPQNLGDFAIGFSLSEGIVQSPEDISSLEMVELDEGIELRMWLKDDKAARLNERRRRIAGPTGCGLCGIDSITEALRQASIVPQGQNFASRDLMSAMQSIGSLQVINIETRAVHAAAFWLPGNGIIALREDVGRHNALDKLAGALAQAKAPASEGAVLLTSRVSVEMVQKTAAIGASVMVAVSAPTALAARMADAAGITLIAIARTDGFEIFTHPDRITTGRTVQGTNHVA